MLSMCKLEVLTDNPFPKVISLNMHVIEITFESVQGKIRPVARE